MNPKLLRYYESEWQHLREMGGEFARDFPKIAGRLGLETQACADPYVERLLEGFSFPAARVQLKVDAEFPRFTNNLLDLVYPQYLAPTPAMAVVRLQPDLGEGSPAQGFKVARGSALHSILGKGDQTACEFRTAHDVPLWLVELAEARYFACGNQLNGVELGRLGQVKAALRLRLRVSAGRDCSEPSLDKLPIHLRRSGVAPARLLDQLLAQAAGMLAMPGTATQSSPPWHEFISNKILHALGASDDKAFLLAEPRSLEGFRLLQEYYALAQHFMFVDIGGLGPAERRCAASEPDILVMFNKLEPSLEAVVNAAYSDLHCSPAIRLFPKRLGCVLLSDQQSDYKMVPDRTRRVDYEIYQIRKVIGYGSGVEAVQTFQSFYRANDLRAGGPGAYYHVRRDTPLLWDRQRLHGQHSSNTGREIFLSLVDVAEAPYRTGLLQLYVDALCNNRELMLSMPPGGGKTDFMVCAGAPVKSVPCVAGPTMLVSSRAGREIAGCLVSQFSLNYLWLRDQGSKTGAATLGDLRWLYCCGIDAAVFRQVKDVRSAPAGAIVQRLSELYTNTARCSNTRRACIQGQRGVCSGNGAEPIPRQVRQPQSLPGYRNPNRPLRGYGHGVVSEIGLMQNPVVLLPPLKPNRLGPTFTTCRTCRSARTRLTANRASSASTRRSGAFEPATTARVRDSTVNGPAAERKSHRRRDLEMADRALSCQRLHPPGAGCSNFFRLLSTDRLGGIKRRIAEGGKEAFTYSERENLRLDVVVQRWRERTIDGNKTNALVTISGELRQHLLAGKRVLAMHADIRGL